MPRVARLRFADGTTVLVKAAVPGELGALAVIMRRGSLTPAAFTTDRDGGAHLLLNCPGEHHRSVPARGRIGPTRLNAGEPTCPNEVARERRGLARARPGSSRPGMGAGPVAALDGVGSRALTKVTSELHLDVRTVLADNR